MPGGHDTMSALEKTYVTAGEKMDASDVETPVATIQTISGCFGHFMAYCHLC